MSLPREATLGLPSAAHRHATRPRRTVRHGSEPVLNERHPDAEETPPSYSSSATAALAEPLPPSADSTAVSGHSKILGEDEVDERAKLTSEPPAYYPPAARREGVEGLVEVFLVVSVDGKVIEASVTRAAGYGFDEAALYAAKRLVFTPAKKDGRVVPVHVHWTCRFRLDR